MNILLISSYPSNFDKSRSVFVYRLMQSLSELGCNIMVISPQPWYNKREKLKSDPGQMEYGNENAVVYRPKYFNFPNKIRIGNRSLGRYNAEMYKNVVEQILQKVEFKPDIVYSHFLYLSGPAAVMAGNHYNVPTVVALGESDLEKHLKIYSKSDMSRLINQFSGVISVSQKNKSYSVEQLGMSLEKIRVFPNAVNHEVFYPRDKQQMRKKYNLPEDQFIIAFTGHFIERKGPLRVLEALHRIEDDNVKGIFIGSGAQEPDGEKVLFKGKVAHSQVAELLSAADVFVLPTLNEGSCNAIVEAMACGLPVVSSDIEAIKEQVNESNGILCDPYNIEEIKNAILSLYNNNELYKNKRNGALETAMLCSSKVRAMGIMEFLNEQIRQINFDCGREFNL